MRTPRCILLIFVLAGLYTVSLAEEEASLPPTTAGQHVDAPLDPVAAGATNGVDEAGTVPAAASQEKDDLEAGEDVDGGEEGGLSRRADGDVDSSLESADNGSAAASAAHDTELRRDGDGADGSLDEVDGAVVADTAAAIAEDAAGMKQELDSNGSDNGDSISAAERALEGEPEDSETGGLIRGWGKHIAGGWGKHVAGRWTGKPFKSALRSYDLLLQEHYLKMAFVQATALGVVGDTIAQRLERRWNPGQRFELRRTAHAGILNMVIDGVFTPHWYNVVDYVNDEMTLSAAFVKALAASAIYGPFANGMFLAGARVLRYGPRGHFDWAEWRRQLAICTVRDFEMWPPLHILNFWLVPKHWRPLTGHLAGVALLVVISSTALTDAALPLGQRAVPLAMRWARGAVDAVGGRGRAKGRRGAPPAGA